MSDMAILSIEEHRQIFIDDLELAKRELEKDSCPRNQRFVEIAKRVLVNFEQTRVKRGE